MTDAERIAQLEERVELLLTRAAHSAELEERVGRLEERLATTEGDLAALKRRDAEIRDALEARRREIEALDKRRREDILARSPEPGRD